MKVQHHVAISTVLAGTFGGILQSWTVAAGVFLMGVFIDIDHVFDYFIQLGPEFNIRRFFHASYQRGYPKAFLILHAWEWAVIWAGIAYLTGFHLFFVGILMGFIQHMILDQIFNRPHEFGYSFFWRLFNKFDFDRTFPLEHWPELRHLRVSDRSQ